MKGSYPTLKLDASLGSLCSLEAWNLENYLWFTMHTQSLDGVPASPFNPKSPSPQIQIQNGDFPLQTEKLRNLF